MRQVRSTNPDLYVRLTTEAPWIRTALYVDRSIIQHGSTDGDRREIEMGWLIKGPEEHGDMGGAKGLFGPNTKGTARRDEEKRPPLRGSKTLLGSSRRTS